MFILKIDKEETENREEVTVIPAKYSKDGTHKMRNERTLHQYRQYVKHLKPTYKICFGKNEDYQFDYEFKSYKDACEMMRYLYGGELTKSVEECFNCIEERDLSSVSKDFTLRI